MSNSLSDEIIMSRIKEVALKTGHKETQEKAIDTLGAFGEKAIKHILEIVEQESSVSAYGLEVIGKIRREGNIIEH